MPTAVGGVTGPADGPARRRGPRPVPVLLCGLMGAGAGYTATSSWPRAAFVGTVMAVGAATVNRRSSPARGEDERG